MGKASGAHQKLLMFLPICTLQKRDVAIHGGIGGYCSENRTSSREFADLAVPMVL